MACCDSAGLEDLEVADVTVVGSEEGCGGRGDYGEVAVGAGEGVYGFEGLPGGEDDDLDFCAANLASQEFRANETGKATEFGEDVAVEVLAIRREIRGGKA